MATVKDCVGRVLLRSPMVATDVFKCLILLKK